jgi:hypothetical protein
MPQRQVVLKQQEGKQRQVVLKQQEIKQLLRVKKIVTGVVEWTFT